MANVIPFDAARRRAAHAARFEQQHHEVEEAGNHAWGRLKKARKLNVGDRKEIAKAMYQLLEELKQRRPNLSIGKLAMDARLSDDLNSKELYRLTLPPGEDPIKRGLRADAQKYVRLLKAIQKHTGENLAQLADRLTWATSLHPKQAQGTEESERMANYLQEVTNRIDLEFKEASGGDSLFETFMKTARIKTDMARQGGRLRWPYYDFDADYDYEFTGQEESDEEGVTNPNSAFTPRREDVFDIQYAYWQRDYEHPYYRLIGKCFCYPAGVAHHEALMNLPRVYLGVVDWDSWSGANMENDAQIHNPKGIQVDPRSIDYFDAPANSEEDDTQADGDFIQFEAEPVSRQSECLKSCVGELGEIRDPETGHANIAHRHPKTGEWIRGLSREYDGEYHYVHESSHVWLVIYPSPDNTTLLPVLYQPMEEGGTLLTPLSQRSLVSLRDLPFVDAGEPRSLYDRIKELMRASSDRAIYKAWQETAKDVLSNPVLRTYREKLAEQDDLERGMAALWDDQ